MADSNGDATVPAAHHSTTERIVSTSNCGDLLVHIQGSIQHANNKAVFLTVHDMGSNHVEFIKFVDHPAMAEVKERSVFIHVVLPGQEDNAADLPASFQFPDMKTITYGLVEVLDALRVQYVIGIGEGAGANILARFGMDHPQRCLGLILIHCTSTVAGVMEYFRDKLINWKLANMGMNPTAEQYLVFHKFGYSLEQQLESSENKEKVIQEYQHKLHRSINPRNLRRYVETFLNRTDLSEVLESKLTTNVMLVAGSLASHLHTVHTMASHMDKTKSTLVIIDGIGDVLLEAPDKFAQNLVLFVQGLGKLSSLPTCRSRTTSQGSEGVEEGRRYRSMSMEEYDVPNVRRLSLAPREGAVN